MELQEARRTRHYTVGELARMAGVTVRTLHHYDAMGLLSPSARSQAGYRLYGEDQVESLQQILTYRELGFDLDSVARLMTEGASDRQAQFRRQHRLLQARIERLQRMVTALEKTMEARTMNIRLSPEERLEVFGDFRPEEHAAEVEERWGQTEAYAESQRRAAGYDKADWQRMQAEMGAIEAGLVEAMESGQPAEGEAAMDLAERHRQAITGWFYDCSLEIHLGLAEMYVSDPRFQAHYEQRAAGLADYLHAAILANAERQAGEAGA